MLWGDSRYNGSNTGNKKIGVNVSYASDPYHGEKIAALAFQIDQKLGGKDYQAYTIAVSGTDTPVYATAGGSAVLYKLMKKQSFSLTGLPLVILEETGSYYKVQSDMPIELGVATCTGTYSFDDVGYVAKTEATILETSAAVPGTGGDNGDDTTTDNGSDDTGNDTNAGGGSDTGNDANTGSGSDTGNDTNTGSGSDTGNDTNTSGGSDTGNDTNTGGGSDTGNDTNTGSGSDTGNDTNTGGGSDTGNDTNTESGSSDTGNDTNTGSGSGDTGNDTNTGSGVTTDNTTGDSGSDTTAGGQSGTTGSGTGSNNTTGGSGTGSNDTTGGSGTGSNDATGGSDGTTSGSTGSGTTGSGTGSSGTSGQQSNSFTGKIEDQTDTRASGSIEEYRQHQVTSNAQGETDDESAAGTDSDKDTISNVPTGDGDNYMMIWLLIGLLAGIEVFILAVRPKRR